MISQEFLGENFRKTHSHNYAHTNTHVRAHTHTHARARAHTHTHTHIHTLAHTHTQWDTLCFEYMTFNEHCRQTHKRSLEWKGLQMGKQIFSRRGKKKDCISKK